MNKVEKIKAEIERLKNELIQEAEKGYKSEFDEGRISAFEDMIVYIDSLEEKPVSEDLVDATQTITYEGEVYTRCYKDKLDAFACKYPMSVPKPSKRYAKYSDVDLIIAVKEGAQWQKERMLNNAIERDVKVDAGGYPYIDVTELYDYDKDRPLAKKGDKVKLIIIMEE